jgi:hypothetical protein
LWLELQGPGAETAITETGNQASQAIKELTMSLTATKTFVATVVLALVAAVTLALTHQVDGSSASHPAVVKLERVVVVGKRAVPASEGTQQIVRLPQVVIEGRSVGAEQRLAAAKASCSSTLC